MLLPMQPAVSRMGVSISPENLIRYGRIYRSLVESYAGQSFRIFQARNQVRDFLRTAGIEDSEIEDMLEEWEEGLAIYGDE